MYVFDVFVIRKEQNFKIKITKKLTKKLLMSVNTTYICM